MTSLTVTLGGQTQAQFHFVFLEWNQKQNLEKYKKGVGWEGERKINKKGRKKLTNKD